MKRTFAKGLGLAMATALVLTGCNLIEVDEVMQANQDMENLNKKYAAAAATYDGGEVTIAEAMGDFNSEYSNMAYMYYYYFGQSIGVEDLTDIAQRTLESKVEAEVVAKHFEDEGNKLTDEQLQEVQSETEESYSSIHGEAIGQATGKNDEAKEANAQLLLAKVGQTKEQIEADKLQHKMSDAMKQQLRDTITEVTDDELQNAYDSLAASNKETYDANPAAYGSDMTGNPDKIIAYVPAGYRTVRHILVIPEESVKTTYTDAVSNLSSAESKLTTLNTEMANMEAAEDKTGLRTAEEIQADIDAANSEIAQCNTAVEAARRACLDNTSEKTTAIYAELEAGTAFADVMAKYGEDPGMQDETTAQTGYYVCESSTNWQSEFTAAAMALANVGDYSAEPVVSGSGVHIIEYYKDVAAGNVELANIHDALYAQTLEEKQNTYCTNTVAEWVAKVNPVYNTDALVSVVTAE